MARQAGNRLKTLECSRAPMLTALLALSSMLLIGSGKLLLRYWSQYPVSRKAIDEHADDIAAEWAAVIANVRRRVVRSGNGVDLAASICRSR
jgi:hypothetical protein